MLDAVEFGGETFVIRRNGHVVARIEPATGVSGTAVKELLAAAPRDASWARDLAELRVDLPAEGSPWGA